MDGRPRRGLCATRRRAHSSECQIVRTHPRARSSSFRPAFAQLSPKSRLLVRMPCKSSWLAGSQPIRRRQSLSLRPTASVGLLCEHETRARRLKDSQGHGLRSLERKSRWSECIACNASSQTRCLSQPLAWSAFSRNVPRRPVKESTASASAPLHERSSTTELRGEPSPGSFRSSSCARIDGTHALAPRVNLRGELVERGTIRLE